jgi:hypothetical protein
VAIIPDTVGLRLKKPTINKPEISGLLFINENRLHLHKHLLYTLQKHSDTSNTP